MKNKIIFLRATFFYASLHCRKLILFLLVQTPTLNWIIQLTWLL